jgi:G:T-mismatch repair DNA endonuclease (very short patch repair protein)
LLLDKLGINYVFQYPILRYDVDFAIPELKIAIECDGEYWHQDKKRDKERQSKIEKEGWFVLRYSETKINQCLNEIEDELARVVGNHTGEYNTLGMHVKKIERWKLKKARTLYNFSVDEDESYIAKGVVVHNCRCTTIPVRMGPEFKAKEFKNIDEIESYTNRISDKNSVLLTASHKKTVQTYVSQDYQAINAMARGITPSEVSYGGRLFSQAEYVQIRNSLDDAIRIGSVENPSHVYAYRGVGYEADQILLNRFRNLEVGEGFKDLGYFSTSVNKSAANNFISSDGVLFKVRVPKGQKVFSPTKMANDFGFGLDDPIPLDEAEFLFGRNTSFEVLSKAKEGEKTIIELGIL